MNKPADYEICQSRLHHLTTALHEKKTIHNYRTNTNLKNRFVAQKANRFLINHYDHAIARYMEDTVLGEDENTNPQITENFFLQSKYVIVINSMNKNMKTLFRPHSETPKLMILISTSSTNFH